VVHARLLGPFAISCGGRDAGPWPRPTAKRLCELVLASPGRRVTRDLACEALFPARRPADAARAVVKALSMARGVLAGLGGPAAGLLAADRANIWVAEDVDLEVDAEDHENELKAAIGMAAGHSRDDRLMAALACDGTLLVDEPYADWAIRPRERLESVRQQARLALARDRAKGAGRCGPGAVAEAWEACLAHDPACEEAAAALVRAYGSQGLRPLAMRAYERCRVGLDELGLRPSPAFQELRAAALFTPDQVRGALVGPSEERRVVSVMFAEVVPPPGALKDDPEDLRELVGQALADVITAVEGLGGTVTSVSGVGLQALFGAPEANEDDPERAVRAAFRALVGGSPVTAALRVGVETGPAIVGPVHAGATSYYRVVGGVVGAAAALQSVARPASVLVGPATRAVTQAVFDWGVTEEVLVAKDNKPLVGAYLEQPRPGAPARPLRMGGRGPLVGRNGELSSLVGALRAIEQGTGSVVVIEGEPGLGKTRLVQECRKRFLAWVGARSGRLPLWAEGRCASYASTTPYGLYRHLLASWAGVSPDQPEEVVGPALERAIAAVMGDKEIWPVLARMMDLSAGAALATMRPLDLQRETFAAVRGVVARLAQAGPTVLALEDLHWADATSLRLTERLADLVLEKPLLILVTRRPHPDPGVSALEDALGAALGANLLHIGLGPLVPDAELRLATILVGDGAAPGAVDAVRAGSEGNPLFLEERLFSMINTGALVGGPGHWYLAEGVSVDVPEVLERMVRSRVDRLSEGAREVVRAASVIGVEPGLALLAASCDASDELAMHLREAAAAGLLGELANAPEPTYRFRHALVQEAVYRGMLRAERRLLHGRCAWALESLSQGRLPEVAGMLARHFAAAAEDQQAVHYFELAGDHALAAFANDEAITVFRSALEIAERKTSHSEAMSGSALGLRGKLAQVLWRVRRRDEARAVLQDAIRLAGHADVHQRVTLALLLGQMEIDEHCFSAAEAAYDAAEGLLGDRPAEKDEATISLWIEVMLSGRAQLYCQRSEVERARAVLSSVRPLVETQGSVFLKHLYYRYLAWQQTLALGWRVDDEVIASARLSASLAAEGGEESDIYREKGPATAWASLFLGFFLLVRGDLEEAGERLWEASVVAETSGDVILRVCTLYCLAVAALRRGDKGAVRRIAPEAAAAAIDIDIPPIASVAKGCLAWLAWQDERFEDVTALAEEAAVLWRATSEAWGTARICKWVYIWPLVALRLREGRISEAVTVAHEMLEPSQQGFPEKLEAVLESASLDFHNNAPETAEKGLRRALGLAKELHFF
jgi:DNA-binding SARP family transcriptional activator/tetratricopeptide (TPR) repeat protein